MEDSDEELPTLSADTFAALQQFYKEEVSFVLNLMIWKGDKCTYKVNSQYKKLGPNALRFTYKKEYLPMWGHIVALILCFYS